MASKAVEDLVYDFLVEQLAAFATLGGDFEIHPTPYDTRQKNAGIEIGDADTSMLPNGNQDGMTEYDGLLTIEIFARVEGTDKTVRSPARQKVYDIKKIVLKLFEQYPTLNGRGCRVLPLRQVRFFDDTKADKYAIERMPVVLNPKDLRGD